jgi:RNA polymerase sigma-70 factor (ECF subfamily)
MAEPLSWARQEAEEPDATLMARLREGDRQAFAQLIERHKNAVVNYLTRISGSRDRAEDLGQETFLRLFRFAGGYVEQGCLRAYLYRIATNLVRSEQRRDRRHRLLLPLFGAGAERSEPSPSGGLLRNEIQRQVVAALAEVPLRYRVPLVLHEIEGWPYAEIAAHLGCREGTVKSRVFRGRQHLKRCLESYWNEGVPCKTTSSIPC